MNSSASNSSKQLTASDSSIKLDELRWLDQHARHLLAEPAQAKSQKLSTLQRGWLQEQRLLQSRAAARFPNPEQWLWTDRSLSQASDWLSARFKAGYFAAEQAVVDACCGAGADAVAIASRGSPVTAVDADPAMTLLAEINAGRQRLSIRTITQPLSMELVRHLASDHAGIHIDPDRRPNDRRTSHGDAFSPPIAEVLDYAEQFATAVIKLAPSTRLDVELEQQIDQRFARVWLGNRGECRQQLLVRGSLSDPVPAGREAGLIAEQPDSSCNNALELSCRRYSLADRFNLETTGWDAVTYDVGRYVFDLHPVLHASRLQVAWGHSQGMQPLSEPTGYHTSGSLPHATAWSEGWCQAFEVREILPWDDRQVRRWLRSFGAGAVEVKCRLAKLDANAFQRRYQSDSGQPVTLLVTKLDGKTRAIAATRPQL